MADVATAKKIIERLGARVRVLNVLVGSNAPAIVFITETANWQAYGEFSARLEADSEWQKFLEKFLNNRDASAGLIGSGLSTDVAVG